MSSLKGIFDKPKAQGFDLYDLRVDIEKAINDIGGIVVTGAGCGDGQADISIEVDGREFWIDIKEIMHHGL